MNATTTSRFVSGTALRTAALEALRKLHPLALAKNPVMFVVAAGTLVTIVDLCRDVLASGTVDLFSLQIVLWLLATILFSNIAEALAEGRGKTQAESLRKTRSDTQARLVRDSRETMVPAATLHIGDIVVCDAGDTIPGDGDVVDGIATVDESAITGESAPVIREAGGDRSAVTGGTHVLSDRIHVRITAEPGATFLDRMIALVEGARRQKTPNEIALTVLLVVLTLVFVLAVVTIPFYVRYVTGSYTTIPIPVLVALLVCLIPTTIGGLLSAIGISGMDRLLRRNVLAMSGKAVEAAGDIDVLLLDKTGTITIGSRMATEFVPAPAVQASALAESAQRASMADDTPEGRSIVALARQRGFDIREWPVQDMQGTFVPFSAQTRMSGVNMVTPSGIRHIRKGAADAVRTLVESAGGVFPTAVTADVERIARAGGTPLVVCDGGTVMGVIALSDVVKGGIRERFEQLRTMGIRTVMITGDNPLTAASIAAEAGVDDFIAEARPEDKLARIRHEQAQGRLVAMIGDGTNDAPALAQADVGVAMNTGTQAAREAGNMIDLDSNPTKLIEIVEIGKQLLMTRGALTTFSIANDVAKYFAILPAIFGGLYAMAGPGPLAALNVMGLASARSAILSAVIFNAVIIIALVPLALRGVAYRPVGTAAVLRRNLIVYGGGGLVLPFVGIKIVDIIITTLGLI